MTFTPLTLKERLALQLVAVHEKANAEDRERRLEIRRSIEAWEQSGGMDRWAEWAEAERTKRTPAAAHAAA